MKGKRAFTVWNQNVETREGWTMENSFQPHFLYAHWEIWPKNWVPEKWTDKYDLNTCVQFFNVSTWLMLDTKALWTLSFSSVILLKFLNTFIYHTSFYWWWKKGSQEYLYEHIPVGPRGTLPPLNWKVRDPLVARPSANFHQSFCWEIMITKKVSHHAL